MVQSSNNNNLWSISTCRIAGYGLLAIAFFNLVDAFIPTYFSDPDWKLNTVNTLIERMPVALVGAVLVFFGGADYRSRWEKLLLKGLSWATVVAGVLFLLLVPLVVSAAMQIDTQRTIQINARYSQQMTQIEQMQAQLEQATPAQMSALIEAVQKQTATLKISSAEDLKRQVAKDAEQARQTALANSKAEQMTQRLTLRKSVIKWSLSALVSAFLFFFIWRTTRWARHPNKAWAIAQARG
jgi:hypothetical protein